LTAALLAGCGSVDLRQGISDPRLADRAIVPGIQGARAWGDITPADLVAETRRLAPNLPRLAQAANRVNGRPVVEILALSGGGGDGAFGAGLLKGWTARGDRPQFEIVTGVSAGAIIAPFAFLGPRYDQALEEIWTAYSTNQLVVAQIVPGLLGGSSLADTSQLQQLVARYVDRGMMREIAAEYRKGRLLLVLTTNLDAQRPVVWNMGEIAASRHPDALELFRKVILASAAIPGAFPPVNIKVEVDGKAYDEMHVDGGVTREVFVSPVQASLKAFDKLYPVPPLRRIFVVKNGKIAAEQAVIAPQTVAIAGRAITTLTKAQNQGDLYRIWRRAQDGGAEFKFIAVPADFQAKANEFFDPAYQKALFNQGYEMGRSGKDWLEVPPGVGGNE